MGKREINSKVRNEDRRETRLREQRRIEGLNVSNPIADPSERRGSNGVFKAIVGEMCASWRNVMATAPAAAKRYRQGRISMATLRRIAARKASAAPTRKAA